MNTCKSCKYRAPDGQCLSEKLAEDSSQEDSSQEDSEKQDMLIYSYYERGWFWVGENFGCVHHSKSFGK